ncbi:MAG: MFS transporter, partial [Oscillospiraceae bacterium]|nr:MFS transporter [Oscillospiraceae bacterium]
TPSHLLGKMTAYIMTLTMCAQPVGQGAFGLFFDMAAGRSWLVLLPAGVLICALGLGSRRLFERW